MLGNLSYFGAVFLLTPIAIRQLGAEAWGIWQLVGASAAYAHLLNLSLGTALHYQVAFRTASGDFSRLAIVFTNVRLYLLLAGLLLLAALALGGRPFVNALVEPRLAGVAYAALCVSIGLTSLDLQFRLWGSALGGLQRMDLYGALQLVGALLLFGAVALGFRSGLGLVGFTALMTLGPSVASLLSYFPARRLLPRNALRLVRPEWPLFREMVAYSLSTILYSAGAVVLYQTMKFVASLRCGGPEAAGRMGLAISLAQTLSVVFTPAVSALHSRVSQLFGEGRLAEVPPLLERALVALGLVLVPSVAFLAIDTPAIFAAWLGGAVTPAQQAELAATTRLLFVGHAFYVAVLPFYYALLGVGEHRVFGLGMMGIALLNTALGWLVAGASGRIESLALVYGFLMLGLATLVTVPAAMRRFALPLRRILLRGVAAPLLAALPAGFAVAWRPRLGQPLADLALDAVLFVALSAPALEFARRRYGVPLPVGRRG